MSVVKEILDERDRQDALWGGPTHDDGHTQNEWLSFIQLYVDKADDPALFRKELVRVAALAVAAIQAYDRRGQRGEWE